MATAITAAAAGQSPRRRISLAIDLIIPGRSTPVVARLRSRPTFDGPVLRCYKAMPPPGPGIAPPVVTRTARANDRRPPRDLS